MNPNVWDIKEMLSVPPGNSSNTNRTGVTNHSGLTDSQFMGCSQLWPENSQRMSQEMSFPSRTSQQSSQEGCDPRNSSNYHTKPFLFGGEGRGSVLERFEDDKKKAKEKSESDLLAKECLYFREMLNNMKHSVVDTEKNTAVCKSILEGFDKFATTLQQNLSSLHNDTVQRFETMLNKVSSQTQELTKMGERLLKTGEASTEIGSHVQALQKNLETLREEQGKEHYMLQEALSLLSTLVSRHPTQPDPVRVTDSAVQTSPGPVRPFSGLQQNSWPEQLAVTSPDRGGWVLAAHRAVTSPDRSGCVPIRRKRNRRQSAQHQRNDENTGHINQVAASPLKQLHSWNRMASPKPDPRIGYDREPRSNKTTGSNVTPYTLRSLDSNRPVCITANLPTGTKIKNDFWQVLFDSCDSDPFPVKE